MQLQGFCLKSKTKLKQTRVTDLKISGRVITIPLSKWWQLDKVSTKYDIFYYILLPLMLFLEVEIELFW